MNLNVESWKEFRLGDLFSEIYKAEAHVKGELECYNVPSDNTIRFISRTEMNNGCDCYVLNNDLSGIEKANAIAIGDTTATCFYQGEDFVCGDHMVICRADWLNLYTALFLISILKQEKYKYSYGRAFKMDLISNTIIKLPSTPDNEPDWNYMEQYIKSIKHKRLSTANQGGYSSLTLGVENWVEFCVGDLFEVKKGKRLTSDDQTDGDTPYIGAIDSNNGVANYIGQGAIHDGNTISLSYNGSVGEAFYQPKPFWATDDVNVLYFRKENGVAFNKYIALFICAVLRQEKYRYSYGRKWVLESMKSTIIKLPEKSGKPDWCYMENYMKSLPYGDKI
ncbi:MAG: restriction endonuclease subunit S [Clostridiales bacterium]|nr:restriction endonuclease subunit S [Clostridiales bacterium]